ncbi:hypothetical protein JOB18_010228 [Solea senegalensis]|uniref:Uncharacterized protein n=1 Tax=Solea senegalensis TaxID=28829 RepID=A0AAV6QDY2_SOLSE|nr:hypothetical protein JOB18_010228 [Solea senegalensis]
MQPWQYKKIMNFFRSSLDRSTVVRTDGDVEQGRTSQGLDLHWTMKVL